MEFVNLWSRRDSMHMVFSSFFFGCLELHGLVLGVVKREYYLLLLLSLLKILVHGLAS